MSKKLEELFNLAPSEDDNDSENELANNNELPTTKETLAEINNTIDKIDAALPAVRGLDASDKEMDDLANKATESYDELMSLGMQVDSRYASEIFSVASQMLGHAITAKNAKLTKKLKMIELQMKKMKLDQDNGNNDNLPTAYGQVIDRNELLEKLANRNKPN